MILGPGLALTDLTPLGEKSWVPYHIVYIVEAVMLVLFGIAWLVKGKLKFTEFVLNKIQR